jgi:hypothetical protein
MVGPIEVENKRYQLLPMSTIHGAIDEIVPAEGKGQ